MAKYKVLTDRVTIAKKGATVELVDSPQTAALVRAGHLQLKQEKLVESKPDPKDAA